MSLSTIYDQVIELVRYEAVSKIGTGDKIRDNTLNVFVMSLIAYGSTKFKGLAQRLYSKYDKDRIKKKNQAKKKKVNTVVAAQEAPEGRPIDTPSMEVLVERYYGVTITAFHWRVPIGNPELRDVLLNKLRRMYPYSFASHKLQPIRSNQGHHQVLDFLPSSGPKSQVLIPDLCCTNFPCWYTTKNAKFVIAHRPSEDEPLVFLSDCKAAMLSWLSFISPDVMAFPRDTLMVPQPQPVEVPKIVEQNDKDKDDDLVDLPIERRNTQHMYDLIKHSTGTPQTPMPIDKRWTLDCMTFRCKPELVGFIKRYKEGVRSLDPFSCSKMGLLLTSRPGCGKSSIVSALANHFQKPVFTVDLSQADDKDSFQKALNHATEEGGIILFDEFDLLLENMLRQPTKAKSRDRQAEIMRTKKSMMQLKAMEAMEQFEDEKKRLNDLIQNEKKCPLDLGSFLSTLDGVSDQRGRIIVATTNHPENIPEALLRPGRFDVKLRMGAFNDSEVKSMLLRIYRDRGLTEEDKKTLLDKYTFPDEVWSPAEVLCAFHVHGSLFKLADHLQSQTPKVFGGFTNTAPDPEKQESTIADMTSEDISPPDSPVYSPFEGPVFFEPLGKRKRKTPARRTSSNKK